MGSIWRFVCVRLCWAWQGIRSLKAQLCHTAPKGSPRRYTAYTLALKGQPYHEFRGPYVQNTGTWTLLGREAISEPYEIRTVEGKHAAQIKADKFEASDLHLRGSGSGSLRSKYKRHEDSESLYKELCMRFGQSSPYSQLVLEPVQQNDACRGLLHTADQKLNNMLNNPRAPNSQKSVLFVYF